MKAYLIETYGVHIGWAAWIMGGWLVFDAKGSFVEWVYNGTNIRELLEDYWSPEWT